MKTLWVTFWVAVYMALAILDWLWQAGSRVMDTRAFAWAVAVADVAILLRILGVW